MSCLCCFVCSHVRRSKPSQLESAREEYGDLIYYELANLIYYVLVDKYIVVIYYYVVDLVFLNLKED